jgi:transmembrane sensor
MAGERLYNLFDKYRSKSCTNEEKQELAMLCLLRENQRAIEKLLESAWNDLHVTEDMPKEKAEEILRRILYDANSAVNTAGSPSTGAQDEWSVVSSEKEGGKVRRLTIWKRIAVAAGLVGVLFMGYWLMKDKTMVDGQQTIVTDIKNDVQAPDKNRASIKLADGRIVYLDSSGNGQLALVNGVKVSKMDDGKIEYSPSTIAQGESGVASGELMYNTLTNPRGSKVIDMTLSDGSRVWLNAGSSITYPVAFVGNERKVTIAGEGYFEIRQQTTADGQRKKFIVESGTIQVEVLGTHFNVNAYDDDSEIKVTLLEGSVNVNRESSIVRLKPGEQVRATGDGQWAMSKEVDEEQVMAWKNGWFRFNSEPVVDIMKDISRWYDVEVIYESSVGNETFSGIVSRSSKVSEVLEIMKLGGVKFNVEGKKITVLK